jgi:hypothetical protein
MWAILTSVKMENCFLSGCADFMFLGVHNIYLARDDRQRIPVNLEIKNGVFILKRSKGETIECIDIIDGLDLTEYTPN